MEASLQPSDEGRSSGPETTSMNHRRIDLMATQPGKSSKMAVAVVVPTLNERGGVTDLIPQIKRVLNEYTTEIVVVDGNSSDGTANLAKDLGAHVIKQDGSGYGDALQLGFKFAHSTLKADITVMIDGGMAYATEMIAEITQVGGRLMELPISYSRRVGKSKLRPVRDGLQILATMLRLVRDYRPLLLLGGAGVILVMAGVVLGLNSFYEWLTFGYVTHPPLVVLFSLMILSGVQLLSFGLIADMIKSLRRDFRRNIH